MQVAVLFQINSGKFCKCMNIEQVTSLFFVVALRLNTNTHIFLTHSFGTQVQSEHSMHLGQFRVKAEAVKVAAGWSLNYKYPNHFNTLSLFFICTSSLVNQLHDINRWDNPNFYLVMQEDRTSTD